MLGFLTQLGQHPEITRTALADSQSSPRGNREPLQASLGDIERSLAEINRQVTNCVHAIAIGGVEALSEELKQRVLTLRERRQELIVVREQLQQDLRPCDGNILDERRILTAIARLDELLPRLAPDEQKQLVTLLIDRIDVCAVRPAEYATSHRSLKFEIKLHLPELVQGMEQKVIVELTPRRVAFADQ